MALFPATHREGEAAVLQLHCEVNGRLGPTWETPVYLRKWNPSFKQLANEIWEHNPYFEAGDIIIYTKGCLNICGNLDAGMS